MEELNLPVKYVMKEWSIALKTFERGDADIILANARRYKKGHYAISENIVNYNRVCVAMHSDSIGMVTLKQLEREGAVFKPGDYSAYYFQDGDTINTSFMEFQTPKVALTGLINGDYKYYVWGEAPLKWKIKELQLEGIILNDVSIPISEIHIIGRDKELIERMDDQYSRLKQSGVIAQLQDKWLHPERVKDESTPFIDTDSPHLSVHPSGQSSREERHPPIDRTERHDVQSSAHGQLQCDGVRHQERSHDQPLRPYPA